MAFRIPSSFAHAAWQAASDLDLDLTALLVESGLSPMDLNPADLRLRGEQAIRLVDTAQRMTGDDLLGLGDAPVPAGTLRLLCYATASATTFGEAITRFADLVRALPGIPDVRLAAEDTRWVMRCTPLTSDGPRHVVTVTLVAAFVQFVSWATEDWSPVQLVELPFPVPDNAHDVALALGTEIRYDAPEVGLVMPASMQSARITRNEKSVLDYLAVLPAQVVTPRREAESLSARVRRMIEKDLDSCRVSSAESLAADLLISTPTLRRRLRTESVSVREIRDEVLANRAMDALRSTGQPVTELAERLGFSETSAFTRAFRRWTGSSPSAFRESARTAVSAAAGPDVRGISA
ncbi:AraC family transcriptional regulator ligand-binding domain-containing protein [Mycolicibacterium lutetiense]